jgi:molybdopterin-containing oxidoreductase family membrane subunit
MDLLGRLFAGAALACGYFYLAEVFLLLVEDPDTSAGMAARAFGPYWPHYWGAAALVVVVPQLLWLSALRRRAVVQVAVGLLAAAGVWLDRYSLVVGGLAHDHLPRTGPLYAPSGAEWMLLLGTIGLFALLLLLFARHLPVISMFETRHEESEAEAP